MKIDSIGSSFNCRPAARLRDISIGWRRRLRRDPVVDMHADAGGKELRVFRHQQPRRRPARPPRLVAPLFTDHRERNQQDVRHAVREFDDGARHVVVRRDDDQRAETALLRPAPRFGGVAAGIDRRVVEIDAAGEPRLVVAQRTGDFAGAVRPVHARDQQPLAVAAGKQIDGVRRPATSLRSARRCHPPDFSAALRPTAAAQKPHEARRR